MDSNKAITIFWAFNDKPPLQKIARILKQVPKAKLWEACGNANGFMLILATTKKQAQTTFNSFVARSLPKHLKDQIPTVKKW